MLRFILNKLVLIVPTVIGITIASFSFIRLLPGDPILAMAGQHGVTPERYEILKEQFGFNLGDDYRRLGAAAQAREHLALAQGSMSVLPDDGYGRMIRNGITTLAERLGVPAQATAWAAS